MKQPFCIEIETNTFQNHKISLSTAKKGAFQTKIWLCICQISAKKDC